MSRGFTLLEVVSTLAVLAILASIGTPAYRNFVSRAKIAEGFSLADELKTRVSLFYQKNSRFPDPSNANDATAWATSNVYASSYNAYIKYGTTTNVPTINPASGTAMAPIQIWITGSALGQTADGVILLVGIPDAGSNINWNCAFSNLSSSYTTGPSGVDISPSLWPSTCQRY